jgi:hypothetical protein
MIGENQTIRRPQSLVQRIRRVVLLELPAWEQAFSTGILSPGRHAFWQFPRGTIGGDDGENDMAAPSLPTSTMCRAHGISRRSTSPRSVNAIYFDSVLIIPLIGKMIHSFTGAVVKLYGAYLFLCFVLSGVMMTLVLIAAKIRNAVAPATTPREIAEIRERACFSTRTHRGEKVGTAQG